MIRSAEFILAPIALGVSQPRDPSHHVIARSVGTIIRRVK